MMAPGFGHVVTLVCCLALCIPTLSSATCRDDYYCTTWSQCSDEDAARRTGYICSSYPWYNGRAPPLKSGLDDWDTRVKYFTCTAANVTACTDWVTREDSSGWLGIGLAACGELASDSTHCLQWSVEHDEVSKCPSDWWQAGGTRTLVDGSTVRTECCGRTCDDDDNCYTTCAVRTIRNASSTCNCTSSQAAPLAGGGTHAYCSAWSCAKTNHDGSRELEGSTCRRTSAEDGYCSEWEGGASGVSSFWVSLCSCLETGSTQSSGLKHCGRWSCFEKGLPYEYEPRLGWIAFAVLLAAPICLIGLVAGLASLSKMSSASRQRAPLILQCSAFCLCFCAGGPGLLYVTVLEGGVIPLTVGLCLIGCFVLSSCVGAAVVSCAK
mmetsp:Transcript_8522/g.26748  ORF Transcript_8522/g.26748 Transcript_8522/m.26748 type:complete len:380 (-) Transcript_8522:16-1155(-)